MRTQLQGSPTVQYAGALTDYKFFIVSTDVSAELHVDDFSLQLAARPSFSLTLSIRGADDADVSVLTLGTVVSEGAGSWTLLSGSAQLTFLGEIAEMHIGVETTPE